MGQSAHLGSAQTPWNEVNRCFMCEEDEKNIGHLLIHCKSAKMLWNLFLSIVGTSWVFPQSMLHTLLAWQGAAVGKKRKRIWLAAPLCLFWTLWRGRNRLVFENESTTDQKIKANFVSNLWAWANVYRDDKTNSVVEFLTWLGSSSFLAFVSCLVGSLCPRPVYSWELSLHL